MRFVALTPSPSPTLWERGVGANGGAFPLSRRRERGTKGVRAIQRACPFTLAPFVALTPSPSPTLWERGVGANGGAFPLSRRRERGTKGVRAIQRACPFTLAPFVALTPSPSPTLWERGVGANGCSPTFGVVRKLRFRTPYIVCVTMRTP
jgi:hypothetical protein